MRHAKQMFKHLVDRLVPSAVGQARRERRRPLRWTGLEGLENRVMMSAAPITIGVVSAPAAVTKGLPITITAANVVDNAGSTITHVEFVLAKTSGATSITAGDLILGFGRESSTTPANWLITTSTANPLFLPGTDNILVIATDKLKNKGTADGTVTVNDTPPTIKTLIAPKQIAGGNTFILTATGVADKFTKLEKVTFSMNGVVLGTSDGVGGWHLEVTPALLAADSITLPAAGATVQFSAVATDVDQTVGTTLAQTDYTKVVAPPTTGALTVSPTTAAIGAKVTLSLADVTAFAPASTSDKKIRVAFYYNAGSNDVLGIHSFFLGYGKFDTTANEWVLSTHVGKKATVGADTLLAVAIDSDGFDSAPATTILTVTAAAT